jgi:hypothetical protein
LLLLGQWIAYSADPFTIVTTTAITALKDWLIATEVGSAVVTKKTAALGAMISIFMNVASAYRTQARIA